MLHSSITSHFDKSMTTSLTTSTVSPIAAAGRRLDNFLGKVFTIKPSEFAQCLHRANEMTRFAGEGRMSPNQVQELRMMAGVDRTAN